MKRYWLFTTSLLAIVLVLLLKLTARPPSVPPVSATTAHATMANDRKNPSTGFHPNLSAPAPTNTAATAEDEPHLKSLTPEQVEQFVQRSKRSIESLIGAFEETRDTNYLQEAARRFPSNSLVQLSVLTDDLLKTNLPPEERKALLDRFKSSSPQNAVPNYLAALHDFKEGQPDAALAELADAAKKQKADAFYSERLHDREEMYLLSGFTPLEAKEAAMTQMLLPLEAKMKGIATQLAELQQNNINAGNTASAEQIAALGVSLGQQWQNKGPASSLITDLVGFAMERLALEKLEPNKFYDFLGKTAGERVQELKTQREQYSAWSKDEAAIYPQLNDPDKLAYWDRIKFYGAANAIKWLHERYGSTP